MRPKLEPENLVTIFLGLCFIVTGLYAYHYMGRFLDTAREASGVVIDVRYESANKKGRMHPRVRFTTADGREVVAQSDEHHNVQRGDTVRLIYDPSQPNDMEISTLARAQKRRLLITTLSVVFGVFVCLLGLRVIVLPGS
jgi:Protein of unknown function (DUF3592)